MPGDHAPRQVNTVDVAVSLGQEPVYRTARGAAFLGDSEKLLARIQTGTVSLVFTSPPYALHFKKEYGNAHKRDYVRWFIPFAKQILRILKDDGSFVLNIGGSYNEGAPTRSLYHFHLLIALVEEVGFHLAQECFWYNPAKMPMPAEWVTVRRIRIKDSVEYVWWLSKTPWPKASNVRVLKEYSPDMIRLSRRGVRPTVRPSGHVIQNWVSRCTLPGFPLLCRSSLLSCSRMKATRSSTRSLDQTRQG
jgi:hypothetical protein